MKYNVLTRVVSIVEADSPHEARDRAEAQIVLPDSAELYRDKNRPGDVQEVPWDWDDDGNTIEKD